MQLIETLLFHKFFDLFIERDHLIDVVAEIYVLNFHFRILEPLFDLLHELLLSHCEWDIPHEHTKVRGWYLLAVELDAQANEIFPQENRVQQEINDPYHVEVDYHVSHEFRVFKYEGIQLFVSCADEDWADWKLLDEGGCFINKGIFLQKSHYKD